MKKRNSEFNDIIEPIINNKEFLKLKNVAHHGISRYDHSMRVAIHTYRVTKLIHLNYQEATEAALLHDFFLDEVREQNGYQRLVNHPKYALMNAKKFFSLSDMQEDIILSHMFPVSFVPPKYLESWIVDFIDDIAAIYERSCCVQKQLSAASTFLFIAILNFLRLR